MPARLENVPLQTRRQMCYQHDGAPPHFSEVVRQYLNHKFPNWWIGRGGAQNWPPRSQDLNQLDYHVWGESYGVYRQGEHDSTAPANSQRCKMHQNAALLRKVTSFLVKRVGKCIQADGGHFEQVAWVLSGEQQQPISINAHCSSIISHSLYFESS